MLLKRNKTFALISNSLKSLYLSVIFVLLLLCSKADAFRTEVNQILLYNSSHSWPKGKFPLVENSSLEAFENILIVRTNNQSVFGLYLHSLFLKIGNYNSASIHYFPIGPQPAGRPACFVNSNLWNKFWQLLLRSSCNKTKFHMMAHALN